MMAGSFTPGDRVRWKASHDPMAAFNARYGFTSPVGTVDRIDDGLIIVTWDSSEGEAQGASSPHAPEELEPAR